MKSICRATVATAAAYSLFFILVLFANKAFPLPMETGTIEVVTRALVRGIVTECVSDEPVPIVLSLEGETEEVTIEGAELPPGVICRTIDNFSGATADGVLTEYRDGWELSGMAYTATIQGLGTKYRIADLADVAPASASGARYIAESEVYFDIELDPLRYFIEFIRRQQGDVADIPATIFMVQKQVVGAVLIFILDYRDVTP